MRKVFLSLVAVLLCSIVSFAQSDTISINSAEDFLNIGKDPNYPVNSPYKQTADIDLGTFTQETAIIPTFSGTYDGNGYSITYQAVFVAPENNRKLGLFGTVSGTIKNLKLTNCSMTASSNGGATANIGLLCGYLNGGSALITDCNIINGTINSTIATTGNFERVATGLIVGVLDNGWIKYSSATGSVVGFGYVGGLVGQSTGGKVYGSSFQGSVTATFVEDNMLGSIVGGLAGTGRGGYAGGIMGFADNDSEINLCYVKADINAPHEANGVGSASQKPWLWGNTGSPDVTNCYAEGTLDGKTIGEGNITNSSGTVSGNYYEGATASGCSPQQTTAECIAKKLNDAVPEADENKIHFSVSGDDNVIFGVVSTESVCETPTNLTITKNDDGTYTASWEVVAVDEEAPSVFVWTLKREEDALNVEWSDPVLEENVWSISTESPLDASLNAYTFYVKSKCSEVLFSEEVSIPFYVACPTPTGLTASNITDNGFKIFWTADVECQVSLYDNEEILVGNKEIILSNQDKIKLYEGLNPETQYTVTVKAKCGNEYVEQASINVTTARLAAPTGLTVTPTWQSTSGKIVVEWDMLPGLTYEIDGESGDKVSEFVKTGLGEGAYTLKLRAKKGTKTSEWVSMPYTISNPEAPKNPVVTYDQQGESFNVKIEWEQGVEGVVTWFVAENTADLDGDPISMPYVLTNQQAGEAFSILIKEKSNNGQNVSQALVVPIQVPCLDASEPTSIVPALNSVTFNFEVAKTRKIFIGSAKYDANATSVTIDGLTEGTSYAYEIREYCNVETNTYSSISSTFSTLACYAVKNLSVSNIGVTNATISWESLNLEYKVVVNEGDSIIKDSTIQNKTINLTGLTPATTYTVRVSEQCGTEGNWGDERTITFTTMSSDFETIADGEFDNSATWKNGNVPTGDIGTITINHTVSLNSTLILKNSCKIINKGVLIIYQLGELINTTGTNVGGIIEIVSPIKGMNQWTFIGAPFANDYTLGCIIPNTNDIGVVRFNHEGGVWKSDWERTSSEMKAGEGYFAWPFYAGVVTYTTYGDVGEFNATTNTWYKGEYDFTKQPDTELNNADFQFKRNISSTGTDHWMALSNPYPAKLSVSKFWETNKSVLQGGCTYSFNGSSFDIKAAKDGNIGMTEGFFVNFRSGGNDKSVTFEKSQLTNYPSSSSKSSNASSEFIELTLVNGKDKVRVYFAHNEDAEQGYDILDANKMFATTGVAEPYFVTEGIPLIKEEVRDLPYYATMNVRSQEDTVMNFVLTNLPEGYAVSIIDGEEVIDLVEGGVYSTEIASGENADRFKVLVKKNVGLADVEELDVRITNSNRHITITAQENVRTEVYNTLGQKVFETEETNFVLSGVASGAYVVKVQGAKASKSQKIVVE